MQICFLKASKRKYPNNQNFINKVLNIHYWRFWKYVKIGRTTYATDDRTHQQNTKCNKQS